LDKIKITRDEVAYVAHLARLEFTDNEMDRFTFQLNNILLYIDKLAKVETADVQPLSSATQGLNVFREDVVEGSLSVGDSLANAPESRNGFFQVPKVIE